MKAVGKYFSDVYNPTQAESNKFSFWRCGLFVCHVIVLLAIFGILLGIGFANRGIVKEERFNVKADGFTPEDGEVCICETTTFALSDLMPTFSFSSTELLAAGACTLPPYEQCFEDVEFCAEENSGCEENCPNCGDDFRSCTGIALNNDTCSATCQRAYQQCTGRYCQDIVAQTCITECERQGERFPDTVGLCTAQCQEQQQDCSAHFCVKRLFDCYKSCDETYCDYESMRALSFIILDETAAIPDAEVVTIPHYLDKDDYYDFILDYFQARATDWAQTALIRAKGTITNNAIHHCGISQHSLCESFYRLQRIINRDIGPPKLPGYDEFIEVLAQSIYRAAYRAVEEQFTEDPSYRRFLNRCKEVDCLLLKDEPAFDIIFNAVGTAGGFNGIIFTLFATLYIPILYASRQRAKKEPPE